MRNPIQEYNLARSMPIQALAAVLRGVSDMVSLGVAHAALKEKMEAEVAKKGMQAMQSAQAPKVLDKDLAMAQGLGATPADVDVPMGGIVGGEGTFGTGAAGGGSVVAFQAGGQLELPFDDPRMRDRAGRPLMSTQRPGPGVSFSQAFADRMAPAAAAPEPPSFLRRAAKFIRGPLGIPLDLAAASPDLNVGEGEYLDLIKKLASLGYSAEAIEAMTPEQRVAAAQRGPLQAGPTDTGGVPTQTLAGLEAAQGKSEAAPTGGIADLAAAQAQVAQPASFEAITNQAKELAKKYKTDPGTTKDFTAFSKEYVDTLKEAGYDFDLVKDNIRKLAEEKEALKGEKKEAANLRLLEAGLGILGGESPYAFVNIGKGATPALQGLAKDLKEIKKTRRELDKETMQLNLLQNQMAEGKVKYAQGRLDKQEERQARAAEKNAEIEFRIADRMAANSTQRFVAELGADTARTNLQATSLEREAARDDRLIQAALKQASDEVRDNFQSANMTPAQKEAEISRLAKIYYAKMIGLRKGDSAAQTSTDPVAAAQAEMARRGLK